MNDTCVVCFVVEGDDEISIVSGYDVISLWLDGVVIYLGGGDDEW